MSNATILFDDVLCNALSEVQTLELATDDATTAIQNLKTLSECRHLIPEPEATPEPTTVLGKLKVGMTRWWDNETTRVLIKAGGAFAGVALVTWTTVHRDHILTRDALSQANQRNS